MKSLIPSYNRFSHHARRALTHSNLLVVRLRHPFADTGHLLVGVMLTHESLGSQVLHALQMDTATAIDYLQTLSPTIEHASEEMHSADEFNAALAYAADEAAWLGHHYIGTEHLLLGITRANVGNARTLLRYMDVSPEQIRRHVRQMVSGGAREPDLQFAKRNARLTELSRRTITASEQMAVTLDHPTVGFGHLLLVMLLEERSPISTMLREYGLDEAALRERLEAGDTALFTSIERLLNRVLDEAERLGSHYTGMEHLLLTLTSDEEGIALLESFGVRSARLRQRVHDHLQATMLRRTDTPE